METTKTWSTIKEWSEEDRPRERLLLYGIQSLSNSELLAIIINTGTARYTAMDIAHHLLSDAEFNLVELSKKSLEDLKKVKGVGDKKAVTLMAALELGKRRQMAQPMEREKLDNSSKIFRILQPYFMDKKSEEFYVLYLNNALKMIFIHQLHSGGIASVQIDTRLIFKKALELPSVTKIVVAHNHPSGDLKPSEADKMVTRRVRELGALFDIKLIDHLIIHEGDYYSFADNDML